MSKIENQELVNEKISIKEQSTLLYRTLEEITEIKKQINVCVKDGEETNTDFNVRKELEKEFGVDKIKQQKTGNSEIDKLIPSKTGQGKGKIDIFIYNTFDNGLVDVIIEDKSPKDKTKEPLAEGIYYANEMNKHLEDKIRIVIGYNPAKNNDIKLKVLVEDSWENLVVDGKVINRLIGKELIRVIYENPDISNFEFKDVRNFTQKDFINILNQLRNLYRGLPDLATNDKSKIDITISFIALKMILEKEVVKAYKRRYFWNKIKTREDIKNSVEAILNDDLLSKYKTIFKITNSKKGNKQEIEFDFINKITSFEEPKIDDDIDKVIQIYQIINKLPQLHSLNIDLFGETYEVLANKKTKSEFGEFFTRRHIIKSLLDIFYSTNDIINVLKNYNSEEEIKICDTSCGTGGFLTESFKIIANYYNKNKTNYKKEINLSNMAQKVICGLDINGTNITRTQINMYLAGDGFSEIRQQDTLKLDKEEVYDYVVTNVPYGKGEILVDKTITNNKRLEINFVIKIIKLLKHNGKALIIVPDGLLEAPSLSPIREWILKQCKLTTIISLPKFAFAPYTKEKTYAIILEKRSEPLANLLDIENEQYWSYIIDNDGFANSDKKFETGLKEPNGKWKHNELSDWVETKNDGTKKQHKSIMVESFGKEHDEKVDVFYNEWDEKINGKKYGYISFKQVLSQIIENPKKLNDIEVINNINKLNNKELFNSCLFKNKINIKKIKEQFYDGEDPKEDNDFISVLEEVGVVYSYEDECFYSNITETKYLLNLIPEKYFRQPTISFITIKDLENKRIEIENEIKNLTLSISNDSIKNESNNIKERFKNLDSSVLSINGNEYFMKDLFHLYTGKNVTDEDIYNNKGNVPIVTAKTTNNGVSYYADEKYLKELEEKHLIEKECITWTRLGNAGTMFYRDTKFYPNDKCCYAIRKSDIVKYKYAYHVLKNYVKHFTTSNDTLAVFGLEQMANIKITVPSLEVQEQIINEYERISFLRKKLELILAI